MALSLHLKGQDSLRNDAILIGEVRVRAGSDLRDYIGFKSTHIDSALLAVHNHLSIADLLSGNSMIHIKSYGSGGLATPSFRGTGPGHTQVCWNDISLNSPMLGQFDLSLIPAGFIDGVNIYYGAGSMGINSGGFGGVIDLETRPSSDSPAEFTVNPGVGSYGRFSGLVRASTGNERIRSVTKAFLSDAKNDFSYVDNVSEAYPLKKSRENNEVSSAGFIQELHLFLPQNTLSARFWYQSASRKLPSPIISPTASQPETQSDESFRAMISWNNDRKSGEMGLTAAFVSDRLLYDNKPASVHSTNKSGKITLKGNYKRRVSEILSMEASLNDELSLVTTNNYDGSISRNLATLDIVSETDPASWFSARLLIRELLHNDKLLTPDFSLSTEFRPFSYKYWFLKASVSKNSRIPTLNDMYWSPGGNPDLKNETGTAAELTWDMTNFITGPFRLKNDITVFRNNIDDLIQWRPGSYSYWEAVNLGSVISSGIEAGTAISYSFRNLHFNFDAGYVHTRAVAKEKNAENASFKGYQLTYIPENQMNFVLRIKWKKFSGAFNTEYTGRRYLTADNSVYLPHYLISGINLGTRMEGTNHSLDISISVDNLFDAAYQNIAYYPMPGRNIYLSVTYQFKK